MKGKKAFQLTATFLVILILTVVIFTGAIYFTRQFFSTAEQMRATIDRQTEAEIEQLLYQEGALVALPVFKKTTIRGKSDTFALGIKNVLERTGQFYVTIEFSKAFTPGEEIIPTADATYINTKWLLYSQGPYTIPNNKLEMIPVLIMADLKMAEGIATEKGTYSFNVCVFQGVIPSGFSCASPPRPLPPEIYGGKVYKIYLEVA